MTTTILGSLSLLIALLVAGTAAASDGLAAAGPDPARADKLGLYGQFVGDWTFDVVNYRPDGTKSEGKGEWNFFWALEGRAVQDVWITPPRGVREKNSQSAPSGYGTTVRFYDPKLDAWRITWIDPIHGNVQTFVAKKRGSKSSRTRPERTRARRSGGSSSKSSRRPSDGGRSPRPTAARPGRRIRRWWSGASSRVVGPAFSRVATLDRGGTSPPPSLKIAAAHVPLRM